MICPTLTRTHCCISCCRNGVYCMCLAEGHCRSGCGGKCTALLHFTHWPCCGGGGREREGRGGNYRREMATERAVDCEVIHETRTLIPLDLSDPPTCSLRNQKVYSTYGLEGVVGATSAADISVKTCKQTCCLITRTLSRHRRRTYADVVITQLPIY